MWTIGGVGDNLNLLSSISEVVEFGGEDCCDDGDSDEDNDENEDTDKDDDTDSDGDDDSDSNGDDDDSDDSTDIPQQLAAYWAGWTGETYKLYEDYLDVEMTTLYLSFADFSNGAIDTSVSGHLTDVPIKGS